MAGGVIVALLVLTAVFAPLLAPFDPTTLRTGPSLAGPPREHLLGTDQLGRGVVSRVSYGARVSLVIGTAAATFALCVGVPLGLISGYAGGWPHPAVGRVATGGVFHRLGGRARPHPAHPSGRAGRPESGCRRLPTDRR
jgi:peptide/nickel transport system permease protein